MVFSVYINPLKILIKFEFGRVEFGKKIYEISEELSQNSIYFKTNHKVCKTYYEACSKHLEDQIDIMVYKLNNFTYEEVKVIDQRLIK